MQYVLYQLLQRHGHPCDVENFNLPETERCKAFHEQVCHKIFESLGLEIFLTYKKMFVSFILFGMFVMATGDFNVTLSNGDILHEVRPSSCEVKCHSIYAKWVYKIGVKDVTDDAGYL